MLLEKSAGTRDSVMGKLTVQVCPLLCPEWELQYVAQTAQWISINYEQDMRENTAVIFCY